MARTIRIAVDVMGGDDGLRPVVASCLKFLDAHPLSRLTMIGDRAEITSLISHDERFELVDAVNPVTMADRPAHALRNKPDSSMAIAVKLVGQGKADACVSAGNTGALMAYGLHHLGTLPGISRPAICKAVPSQNGCCLLLDLGANITCSSSQLAEFAVMGAAMARVMGKEKPRVGLLNVGREPQKGDGLHKEAARLIEACGSMTFVGFVEGGDIFRGLVDVVVCDGFTGNAVLKASEGAAGLMLQQLKEALSQSVVARCARLLVRPYLKTWRDIYDPARYNGAVLLGLGGVVVKSHGSADEAGFAAALGVAYEHGLHDTPAQIAAAMN